MVEGGGRLARRGRSLVGRDRFRFRWLSGDDRDMDRNVALFRLE